MQIETTAWAVLFKGQIDEHWRIYGDCVRFTRAEAIRAYGHRGWRKDRRKGVVKAVRVRVIAEVDA